MKATTLIALGALAFAGTALAAEPQPQATGASSKIAIDPVTGKRRQMTTEESAALDAQATAAKRVGAARAKSATATATAASGSPATMEEALQNTRVVKGIVGFRAPMDSMSSLTVTRNADGTLTFSESGESQPAPQAREVASE